MCFLDGSDIDFVVVLCTNTPEVTPSTTDIKRSMVCEICTSWTNLTFILQEQPQSSTYHSKDAVQAQCTMLKTETASFRNP